MKKSLFLLVMLCACLLFMVACGADDAGAGVVVIGIDVDNVKLNGRRIFLRDEKMRDVCRQKHGNDGDDQNFPPRFFENFNQKIQADFSHGVSSFLSVIFVDRGMLAFILHTISL